MLAELNKQTDLLMHCGRKSVPPYPLDYGYLISDLEVGHVGKPDCHSNILGNDFHKRNVCLSVINCVTLRYCVVLCAIK